MRKHNWQWWLLWSLIWGVVVTILSATIYAVGILAVLGVIVGFAVPIGIGRFICYLITEAK